MNRGPITLRAAGVALVLIVAGPAPARSPAPPPKPAPPLKLTADVPKSAPTVAQVNEGEYSFHVVLTNIGKEDLVLWPFAAVQVLDPAGTPVPTSMNLGRFGLRRTNSVLEAIRFLTIKPGQSHRLEVNLSRYTHDPTAIKAWRLPGPGVYRVVVTYQYDRADVKKRLGKGAGDLDGPAQPWNRALEVKETIEAPLTVK